MSPWAETNKKIGKAISAIRNRPVLNATARTSLGAIPVVGPFLQAWYDETGGKPDAKTKQILQVLTRLREGNEEQFNKLSEEVESRSELILRELESQNIELADLIRGSRDDISKKLDRLLELEEERDHAPKMDKRTTDEIHRLWGKSKEADNIIAALDRWHLDFWKLKQRLKEKQKSVPFGFGALLYLNDDFHVLKQCDCGEVFGLEKKAYEKWLKLYPNEPMRCKSHDPRFMEKLMKASGAGAMAHISYGLEDESDEEH